MLIEITYGIGTGLTELSAFDSALFNAGIANFNLIKLSSVIPEGAELKVKKVNMNDESHGHKLICVLSSMTQTKKGKSAYSGIGWVQEAKTKKGLFVEHHAPTEKGVIDLINKSLKHMVSYRKQNFGRINSKLVGIKCEGKPVCALVCAIYRIEGWD